MTISIGRKSLMKIGIWSFLLLLLLVAGYFVANFVIPVFADAGYTNALNVTLNTPTNNALVNSKTINFTYTPVWNSSIVIKNCTLYGNFSGTWEVNNSNSTPVVNDTINGIVNTVNADGTYIWNVVCFNETGTVNDTDVSNYTVTVDTTPPVLNETMPVNNTYIYGSSSELFQVKVTDLNLNTSNVTLNWRVYSSPPVSYTPVSLTCYGSGPSYVCNNTVDLSAKANGKVIEYYFEATDNATNYGSNGTASSPLTVTIDRVPPQWSNVGTNDTDNIIGKYDTISLNVLWSDSGSLDKAILATNETGVWKNKTTNYNSPATLSGTSAWSNFTWSNSSIVPGTVIAWKVYANDSVNNQNVTSVNTFTIDGTPPIYSNEATSVPNRTQYVPGRNYGFQIDWNDSVGVDTVFFETDLNSSSLTNFTATHVSENTYVINFTDIGAGNYHYRWLANDTSGNWNISFPSTVYSITQNQTNPINLVINNGTASYINQNVTITYGTNVTVYAVNAYLNSGIAYLFRNDTNVTATENGTSIVLGAGMHSYFANTSGNANYTSNTTDTYYLTVNKAPTTIHLYLNGSEGNLTIASGSAVNATVTATNAQGTLYLYRNGTIYNQTTGVSSIQNISTFTGSPATEFNLTGYYPESENYTAADPVTYWVIIESTPPTYYNNTIGENVTNNTVIGKYGGAIQTSAQWNDNFALDKYWLSSNETGEWKNGTAYSFPAGNWSNITIDPSAFNIGILFQAKIYANDTSGNENVTGIWQWTIDGTPPKLNNTIPVNGTYINGTANQLFQVKVYDDTLNTSNITLYWREQGGLSYTPVSLTCYGSGPSYVCNNTVDLSTEPNNQTLEYYFTASDNSRLVGSNGTASSPLTVTIDRVAPQWSNNVVSHSSGTAYSPGATYQFNVTWVNSPAGVDTVLIENNFTGSLHNETITTHEGNVYYFSVSDLPAGTYVWKEYANDSVGNLNSTYQWTYIVAKATPTLSLVISPTNSTTYPTQTTASGSVITGDATGTYNLSLYRNGTIVSSSLSLSSVEETILLGAGVYNYTLVYNGTQNYTTATLENITNITKGNLANYLDVAIDSVYADKNVTYPTYVTIFGRFNSTGASDITFDLFRNDSNVTSENNTAVLLGAHVYQYKYGTTNTTAANWTTGNSTIRTLTVNKGVLILSITPSKTVTYPTQTTVTGSETNEGDVDVNYTLYRNDTGLVQASTTNGTAPSSDTVTLGAGTYLYTFNTTAGPFENYTTNTTGVTTTVTINKAPVILHIAINETESDQNYIYENVTNVTGWSDTIGQDLIFTLWRDSTNISSGNSVSDIERLGAASYTYTFNTTGGQNYTSNTTTRTLTINPKPISIHLALNGTENNNTYTYPQAINVTLWKDATTESDFNLSIWRTSSFNSQIVASTTSKDSTTEEIILGNGSYNYTATLISTNYTASPIVDRYAFVNKGNPSSYLNLYIDNTTVNKTINYPIIAEIRGNVSTIPGATDLNYTLYRNGILIASGNPAVNDTRLGVGIYVFVYNTTGGQNWTANSSISTLTLNVSKGILSGTISTSDVTYPNNLSVTASENNVGDSDVDYQIICGNLVSSGLSGTFGLGAGTYTCIFNTTSGLFANWTANASIATTTATVNKGTPSFNFYADGNKLTNGTTKTYTYPATITINITNIPTNGASDVYYQLWRNDTGIVKNETGISYYTYTFTPAVGSYEFVANNTEGQNYTIYTIDPTIVVQQGSVAVSLSYENITYGQSEVVNCSANNTDSTANLTLWLGNTLLASNQSSGPIINRTLNSLDWGAGIYTLTCNISATQNFTAASNSQAFNISKATPTLTLDIPTNKTYDGQISYINYSISSYANQLTGNFYTNDSLNGSTVASSQFGLATAGSYNLVFNTSGNENYTSASKSGLFVIDKATPSLSLTASPGWTVTYPTETTVKGVENNIGGTDLTYNLYRDGVLVGQATNNNVSETIELGAGSYNYVFDTTGGQNYTSASISSTLTVNKGVLSGSISAPSVTYPTDLSVSSSESNVGDADVAYQIYCDNVLISSATGSAPSGSYDFGAGDYVCKLNTTSGLFANWTANASIATTTATVNKGTPVLTLTSSPNWTPSDVTAATVTCSASSSNNQIKASLYKNDTNVDSLENGIPIIRAAGSYNFICNTTETENYTANSTSHIMTVTATKGSIEGFIFLTNSSIAPSGSVNVFISGTSKSRIIEPDGYFKFEGLDPGTYTINVSGQGYYGNSIIVSVTAGKTANANMTITGPDNFNITLPPKETYSFWDIGWHSFKLATREFTTIHNYTLANVLSGIKGKFTEVYLFNESSGIWSSYIPGEPHNDLTSFGDHYYTYLIKINATRVRIELEPKYRTGV